MTHIFWRGVWHNVTQIRIVSLGDHGTEVYINDADKPYIIIPGAELEINLTPEAPNANR